MNNRLGYAGNAAPVRSVRNRDENRVRQSGQSETHIVVWVVALQEKQAAEQTLDRREETCIFSLIVSSASFDTG